MSKAAPPSASKPIHVLVIDDSAVVRQVMTTILSTVPGFSVAVASDPIIARDKIKKARPDVILLDIEMPRMDGLTFLHHLMREDPIPVVVCSAVSGAGTEVAFRALEEGAVDIITKPKVGVEAFLTESAIGLADTIRAARQARLSLLVPQRARAADDRRRAPVPQPGKPGPSGAAAKIIAVGASTGGTDALRDFLQGMPVDAPAIVVVQHMPEPFTSAFAERLNQVCTMRIREATDGEPLLQGEALIAPGGRHLLVHRSGGAYVTETREGPLVSRHRPSVDVLMRSVAVAAGRNAVGVIMTGMGDDGAAGLLEMRRAGAATLAQDEATSVVFGMPREAIERGAVDEVLPLPRLAAAVLRRVRPSTGNEPR